MGAPFGHTQKRPVARGHRHHSGGGLAVCAILDDETHAEIACRAQREGTSFAEQVRLLLEWGLETARQEARRQRA